MKNKASIGVVRNAKDATGSTIINCPVCAIEIVRISRKSTVNKVAAVLGIINESWEIPREENAEPNNTPWETVVETHINNHSSADIIARIYALNDNLITAVATIDRLNDFLDNAAGHADWFNNKASIDRIRKYIEYAPNDFIPEQIMDLINPSSLEKTDCF